MTEVAAFVAEALAGCHDVEPITDGYRRRQDHGVTTLTFRPANPASADSPVAEIATIESRFTRDTIMMDPDAEGIAWLNRRAVFGSFFRDDAGLGCRLTHAVYKAPDPMARWVAMDLLEALGQQLALAIGNGRMEVSGKHYRASREALEFPRHWSKRLPSDAFDEVADYLRQWPCASTTTPSSIIFAVPLSPGAITGTADPREESAIVCIRTDIQHPLAGVGYCATITLPRQPPRELLSMWCTRLNAIEHEQEGLFPPRLGAWGKRNLGERIIYGEFKPTDQAGINPLLNLALDMANRSLWIAKNFWTAGIGLDLRSRST